MAFPASTVETFGTMAKGYVLSSVHNDVPIDGFRRHIDDLHRGAIAARVDKLLFPASS